MKLYIIGGRAKNGKNTLANFLKEELKKKGYKPCIMHITEPLYAYARNYFEYNERSGEKPREFLQKMGIEVIREQLGKKTFLLDRLKEDIEILVNFFDTFIIADARLLDEFEYLTKEYGDVTTIKVERERFDDGLSAEEKKHITETEVDKYKSYNYIIKNTGIEDLKESAKEIISAEEGETYE